MTARVSEKQSMSRLPEAPSLRPSALIPITRQPKAAASKVPSIVVNPDGRIQLNTAAVRQLGSAEDRPQVLRLYTDPSKRYLVIQRAEPADPHAIRMFPVGRKDDRWPQVHVARAASVIRQLGLVERVRYNLAWDAKNHWLVADLKEPLPIVPGMPIDQIRPLLEEWVKSASTGEPVPRREFHRQIQQIATRTGRRAALLQRQLAGYVTLHRAELARELGLEATIADGTLRSVVVRRKK